MCQVALNMFCVLSTEIPIFVRYDEELLAGKGRVWRKKKKRRQRRIINAPERSNGMIKERPFYLEIQGTFMAHLSRAQFQWSGMSRSQLRDEDRQWGLLYTGCS